MLARFVAASLSGLLSFVLTSNILFAQPSQHRPLRLAVASNFSNTATELVALFEQQTTIDTQLSIGSTGKITSQIEFGYAVDVFLAADVERPLYLIKKGLVPGNERLTYALGRIVLWSPIENLKLDQNSLQASSLRYLAMANPRLAPYGRAAQQAIEALSVDEVLQDKVVFGENVSQTLQFARSGNAELAFVARSQFIALNEGSAWLVPNNMHEPIEQQAVKLSESSAASLFMQFLASDSARAIIAKHGYELPHG